MNRHISGIALRFVCISVLSLGFGVAANAQTVSGTLRGTVTDANGAVIPNATVIARNVETGLERTVTTTEEGSYNITFLPIGSYTVTATRTDFNRVTHEKVTIGLNETTVL